MKMSNNKQNKRSLLHLLWVLPLALGITIACSEKPEKQSETPALESAEQMPAYPGGNEALFAYMGENIKYPKTAEADSVTGTVFVRFVVNAKGEVTNAEVIKSVDPRLDEVALKTVKDMPNWKPGMNGGEPVSVKMTLPIRFQLD